MDPSTDATFFVQFYRESDAPLVPQEPEESPHALYRDAQWEHRGRDLDSSEEVFEMVTRQHHETPLTPESFDRWLQIFHDTVDGGWSGPNAEIANKRGTGMALAMANRLLGRGVWTPGRALRRPEEHDA